MATKSMNETAERLVESGAHFAHAKSRRHPSMKPFILGSKSKVDILDINKSEEMLTAAKEAFARYGAEGKTIMFVTGKREAIRPIRDAAESIAQPYVAGRWLGGTITNFPEIKKRIKRHAQLEEDRATGALEKKYTKLERLMLSREEARLDERFGGLRGMTELPDVLFVLDTKAEAIAVAEAKCKGIPVVALMSSDCDLVDATYPIVANDASIKTVKFVLAELIESFRAGRDGAKAKAAAPSSESK